MCVRSTPPTSLLDALLHLRRKGESVLEDDEAVDALALNGMWTAHGGRLCHRLVLHNGRLDLSGREQVATDVEHVISATGDPVVTVLVSVTACTQGREGERQKKDKNGHTSHRG